MTRSFFDFIIELHISLVNNPKNIIYLEIVVVFLVILLLILIYIIYFVIKSTNVPYIANTRGISTRPDKTVVDNFQHALKKIESDKEDEILVGLQYLKQHPNPISLQKIGEILANNNVSEQVRNHALETLKYLVKFLR